MRTRLVVERCDRLVSTGRTCCRRAQWDSPNAPVSDAPDRHSSLLHLSPIRQPEITTPCYVFVAEMKKLRRGCQKQKGDEVEGDVPK